MYRFNSINPQQQQQQQQLAAGGSITVATAAGHLIIRQHAPPSSTQILSGIPAGGGGGITGSNNNNGGNNNVGTTTIITATGNASSSSSSQHQINGNNIVTLPTGGNNTIRIEEVKMLTAIKSEPMQQDIKPIIVSGGAVAGSGTSSVPNVVTTVTTANAVASTSTPSSNGHMIFVPAAKRTRLEGPDDWLSSPSPGSVPSSAPPLSPSPGSQSHTFNTSNMSNGYASPMSTGSYDPYSPGGKMGREDLSPSSSLNGYSTNDGCDSKKGKKGPAPRLQEELCLVCGDRASGYHYNALTCEGCKGFFRRSVTKNAVYCCKFGHACEMDMYMRRKCQECRLKKCLAVGMRPECVVPENQCAMKRKEKKAQKERDKQQISPTVSTSDSLMNEILQLMKCDPPPHAAATQLLPEKLLAENRARNIPPLTLNQLALIYKLIWYQDGYEQPSEEDLKRIMISSPDENESQHDVSFRHITEITILTVQLIVEFAKGLPAFNKIPQEDQITLLKACSSEVMMLRMARRYDATSDSIFFANNQSYTRESYKMAGMADNIEDLLHFCRQMYSMTVDNVEYALITAIVIFSDRPGLEEAELVEAIQSYYIDTLRIYILNRHGGDSKCLVFFAKLLSILTELRTLGNQNAEMCVSLKLQNRKLPRFLEEIWDVQAGVGVSSDISSQQNQITTSRNNQDDNINNSSNSNHSNHSNHNNNNNSNSNGSNNNNNNNNNNISNNINCMNTSNTTTITTVTNCNSSSSNNTAA